MEKFRLALTNVDSEVRNEMFEEDQVCVSSSEDEDDGLHRHNQLLNAVRNLDGKNNRARKAQRTEASSTVSEFNLGNVEEDKLDVTNLLSSLGKTITQAKLKKKVSKIEKDAHVLPPPLQKPEAEKIKRIVAYNEICNDLSKWDRVVHQNRQADQLSFPLKQTMLTMEPIEKVVKRFKFSTPLEKEIADLLQTRQPPPNSETVAHLDNSKHFDLMEAMEMRQEMKRMRVQQSYQEAKYRRTNKIKSKRYHRIMKREKLKKEMKDFEELQKTNPELAAEKFQELDNQRILERMTLRHRNTGKWAKYQLLRTKHDKESGRVIQEQIELNRALTAKQFVPSDSEDEILMPSELPTNFDAGMHNRFTNVSQTDSSNPWMSVRKTAIVQAIPSQFANDEGMASTVNYRSYWKDANKKNGRENGYQKEESEVLENKIEGGHCKTSQFTKVKETSNTAAYEEECTDIEVANKISVTDEVEEIFRIAEGEKNKKVETFRKRRRKRNTKTTAVIPVDNQENKKDNSLIEETLVRKRTLEDFENLPAEDIADKKMPLTPQPITDNEAEKSQDIDAAIDPHDFIKVKQKVIKCKAPNMDNYDDDALDDEDGNDQHMTIVEAFADDDVIEEFQREKQAIIDHDTPKDIDLTLPGWGQWGGSGISQKRHRRFVIKAPPAPLRKDAKIGNVIINENADEKLRPHMVSKIPFPYATVEEFEKSIHAPIGKHWIPEVAFQRVITPKIVTKLGSVIDPMDADAIKQDSAGNKSWI